MIVWVSAIPCSILYHIMFIDMIYKWYVWLIYYDTEMHQHNIEYQDIGIDIDIDIDWYG